MSAIEILLILVLVGVVIIVATTGTIITRGTSVYQSVAVAAVDMLNQGKSSVETEGFIRDQYQSLGGDPADLVIKTLRRGLRCGDRTEVTFLYPERTTEQLYLGEVGKVTWVKAEFSTQVKCLSLDERKKKGVVW